MQPLIICAAVTGGAPARAKTPHHPVTPQAVADDAVACWRAGAAIVHIHARLADESTSSEIAAYRDTADRIRAAGCDAILSLSAGDDGGRADHALRLRVAEAGEELVSLDLGPINLGTRLYDNRPAYLREMAKRMLELGVRPEIDVLDSGHLDSLAVLIKDGLVKPPYHVQLVFGVPGGIPLDLRLLPILVSRLPPDSEWSISCQTNDFATFLRFQMAAFTEGGHVRTGMEDHVYVRPGELARNNAEMVEQWSATARTFGRPVATPADARRMLGIAPRG
jgi:3-keto-5-aminohexanoate cleavage enzyme